VPGGRARERAGRGDDGRRPLGAQPAALELAIARETFDRSEGRRVFGLDPAGYHRARPGHPDRVYEILEERCGLGPGTVVLEIGSGTGQATRPLLERGAARLVAIEPDPELADYLPSVTGGKPEILRTTLEDADLPQAAFDLAVAASSFHWVDAKRGLAVIRRALRPGGWWAMWWTHFGDDERADPFRDAIDHLMTDLPSSPGATGISRDPEAALAVLAKAGLERGELELVRSSREWDAEGIRGLFATFSPIARLDPARRDEILDEIARIARDDFGDRVVKPVLTRLHTARNPEGA
jgi:SAM-dependent methyltransferase